MSDKSKKFNPPMGWLVAVQHQTVLIHRFAAELKLSDSAVGFALERSGVILTPDQMDLAADTAKVILLEEKKSENPLSVVPVIHE